MGWFTPKNVAPPPKEAPPPLCIFCKKSQQEVKKLISGDGVMICNECVSLCQEILADEQKSEVPVHHTLSELTAHFERRVVGQGPAIQQVAAILSLHLESPGRYPRRILLAGPRGVGKTTLCRALTEVDPKLPTTLAAASRLTETGYVGENLEHVLAVLLRATDEPRLAEVGVVLLDGLQHLVWRAPFALTARDISGSEVQREIVRLLDGQIASVPQHYLKHPQSQYVDLPCERLMIVATTTYAPEVWPTDERGVRDALAAGGILDEVLARFDLVVPMPALSADALAEVARREIEPIQLLSSARGGEVVVTPEGLQSVAQEALRSGDGAFGLRPALARLTQAVLLTPPPWYLVQAPALELPDPTLQKAR